ncbi:MAG: MCP four helix bundle domain-containing protein [Betaproteobacteria bacterium]|nr:MCP four helix bundle domain-containing protein [Betaproteobacteria bacterium]
MKVILSRLQHFSLGAKLGVGFGLLVLLTLIIGLQGLLTSRETLAVLDRTYQSDVLGVSHLGRAESAFLRIGRHVRQALLTADPTARKEVLSQITQSEAETFQMIESFKTKTFRESTPRRLRG